MEYFQGYGLRKQRKRYTSMHYNERGSPECLICALLITMIIVIGFNISAKNAFLDQVSTEYTCSVTNVAGLQPSIEFSGLFLPTNSVYSIFEIYTDESEYNTRLFDLMESDIIPCYRVSREVYTQYHIDREVRKFDQGIWIPVAVIITIIVCCVCFVVCVVYVEKEEEERNRIGKKRRIQEMNRITELQRNRIEKEEKDKKKVDQSFHLDPKK